MRNEVREAGAALGRLDFMSQMRRQSCDHAIFDLCGSRKWNGEGSVDAVLPVGDVPEPRFLRAKLTSIYPHAAHGCSANMRSRDRQGADSSSSICSANIFGKNGFCRDLVRLLRGS